MTCSDLCTAAKCEELENRIGVLEQALELLEAAFEAHTQQDIPEAHSYTPPAFPDPVEPEVSVAVFELDSDQYGISVQVGTKQAQDSFTITHPDSVEPEVSVAVFELDSDEYGISVQVGTKQAQDSFTIIHPEIPEIPDNNDNNQHVKSNLQGSASFNNNILNINIEDGESSDSFEVFIPINESLQTIFITEEVYMNCDQLENKFDNCCSQIIGELSTLSTQLANVESTINTEVKQVYDEVTIDIKGTVNSKYKCSFPLEEDTEQIIAAYAESETTEIDLTALELKGLPGIYQYLKIMAINLDSIHNDVCKAVDPISTIKVSDIYEYCKASFDIDKSLYFEENGDPKYSNAPQAYNDAIEAYLNNLIDQSKYGYLLDSRVGDNLITAPNNWTTEILADFSLIQAKINQQAICNIKLELPEETDVVSIVASPKYVTNVSDKVLILHFVDLLNYPKRTRGSNYRQIQIPGAKETYNWDDDFKNLTWTTGNQYAELELESYKARVSGWFSSEATANEYFDKVLGLTTAVERNRKFPKHKYPRTDIETQITRPYRAFVESINDQGRAICHVKYVPPTEPDEDGNNTNA